jgi:hypothetical protein
LKHAEFEQPNILPFFASPFCKRFDGYQERAGFGKKWGFGKGWRFGSAIDFVLCFLVFMG